MSNKINFIFPLLMICCLSIQISAVSDDQRFSESYGSTALAQAMSPSRYEDYTNNYIRVTGKCNMPRNIGTSPHVGVDMTMSAGTKVYPIFAGRITNINYDLSGQLGSVTVNADINSDGTPDGYYIKYTHIAPYSSSYISADSANPLSWLSINEDFALIDIERVWAPHLHYQWLTATNGFSKKWADFTNMSVHINMEMILILSVTTVGMMMSYI